VRCWTRRALNCMRTCAPHTHTHTCACFRSQPVRGHNRYASGIFVYGSEHARAGSCVAEAGLGLCKSADARQRSCWRMRGWGGSRGQGGLMAASNSVFKLSQGRWAFQSSGSGTAKDCLGSPASAPRDTAPRSGCGSKTASSAMSACPMTIVEMTGRVKG
jgi:hypothetical protein